MLSQRRVNEVNLLQRIKQKILENNFDEMIVSNVMYSDLISPYMVIKYQGEDFTLELSDGLGD